MIYPFMTLSDNTEITFGKPIENDTGEHVDVFIETPVSTGFKNAYCRLPEYAWRSVDGYSDAEIQYFQELLESTAHLIIRFSKQGGMGCAANI